MDPKYVIVQAGGRGSRMEQLTKNKPKALVPVDNLPIIFHLFRKYPDKKYVVIGDYKYDVLKKYLQAFAQVDYEMVCASGKTGTCSGLKEALDHIPDGEAFMLIWCDLILPKEYAFPVEDGNYIGVAKDFPCRWSYRDGHFVEERSDEYGVAGHFVLKDKSVLAGVPEEGELVRWMSESGLTFREQPLYHTKEYGLYSEWDKLPKQKCRPFNAVEVQGDRFVKRPIDKQGEELAALEVAWYQKINELAKGDSAVNIPRIYDYHPLVMERIDGKNIYEYDSIPNDEKLRILQQLVNGLKHLHALGDVPADRNSFYEAYIGKTIARLEKVRDLVPFADQEVVTINGRACRNVFYHWDELTLQIEKYLPKRFALLHGDCTFSNIMLKNNTVPVMIDPRGYFGTTKFYGDPGYDWAKLYYSLLSNYDQFNLKRFSLDIGEDSVELRIHSNNWEELEDDFFDLLKGEVSRKQMKLYLAVIWLSLTTYAWEDYDSICGAFYQGLLYLEDALLTSEEGTADEYFADTIRILSNALHSIDKNRFEEMLEEAEKTLRNGRKIIASGLGKNVPVCEKFVGSMVSMGLDANFLHTNTAVHGDMGMIKPGDMVIILSKSGDTAESEYLAQLLKKRGTDQWLLTFREGSRVEKIVGRDKCLVIDMEHEGDIWNVMPNNSTTLNLIVLQALAMTLARRMNLDLDRDFKPNHPGGAIGESLRKGEA